MNFKLIKISIFKTSLRVLTLLMIFLPLLPFKDFWKGNLSGIWIFSCVVAFILQILFVRRYSIIGNIEFRQDSIHMHKEGMKKIIPFDKKSKFIIEYTGYKGEPTKGTLSPLLNFSSEEGICKCFLKKGSNITKYNFLSENKEDYIRLEKLVRNLKENNINISLST